MASDMHQNPGESQTPPVAAQQRRAGPSRRHRLGTPSRIALGLLVLGIVVFALLRAHSAEHDFVTAFAHFDPARLPWLILAVGAEMLSFLCYALVQRRLLRAGGARLSRRTMVGLAVAATGITNLVPGGTAPASGWLVGQYRRRSISMPLAMWAVLAGGFAAVVSILVLLVVGAAIAGLLSPLEAVGCAVVVFGGGAALITVVHRLSAVESWLDVRGRHRWARGLRGLATRAAAIVQFRMTVPTGAHVLALSLANWTLDVFCLVASFEVLGRPIPWHAVLFAYAVAQVAGSLAPVPGGIGFVEGGMVGAFALVGSPAGDALAATIVYRAITCWAVAAVGSLMLFVIQRRPAPRANPADAAPSGDEGGHRLRTAPVGDTP